MKSYHFKMHQMIAIAFLISCQIASIAANKEIKCCRKPNPTTMYCSGCHLENVPSLTDTNITSLYLNDNWITVVEDFAFANLLSLKFLSLRYNRLRKVHNDSFVGLVNLESLDMTQMDTYTICPEAFKPLTALKMIKLGKICTDDDVCQFPYKAFAHLTSALKFLELSVPPSISFGQDFSHLHQLQTLVLFGHGCSLPKVTNETFAVFSSSLQALEVHDCKVQEIDINFLKEFRQIETLNLACNRQSNLTKIFEAVKQLPSQTLKTLIADGVTGKHLNQLKFPWFDSESFANLERLSLRMTSLVYLDVTYLYKVPKLKYLNLGYNSILDEKHGNLTKLISYIDKHNLTALDISYVGQAVSAGNIFRQKYCRNADFYSDDFFRKPPPYIDVPAHIPCCNHTVHIDKHDIGYTLAQNIPQSLLFLYASSLGFPKGVVNDIAVNLDNNILYMDFSNTRIEKMNGFFKGFLKLQGLDFSGCGLEHVNQGILENLPSLTFLNMSNNELSHIKLNQFFNNASQLVTIDLSLNRLQGLPKDIFTGLTAVKTLSLNKNALGKLTLNLQNNNNLTFLDLGNTSLIMSQQLMEELDALQERANRLLEVNLEGNIFQCNCDSLDFLQWLQQTKVHLVGKQNLKCDYEKMIHLISSVDLDALNYSCNKMRIVTIAVTPVISVVAVLMLLTLVHRYRWSLKWKFYLLRRSLHYKRIHQQEGAIMPLVDDNISYNAFVSYNHTNEYQWVQDTLLPHVEDNWGFNLCIGQRDFIPGIPIAENICEAIDHSHYVILVITPSFISSGWCDFEMHMALVKGRRHLIIIYKEEVEMEQISKTLRMLMSSINYIEYSETAEGNELFWKRLKDALTGHLDEV